MEPPEEELQMLSALILRLAGAVRRFMARELAGYGLTPPQLMALMALDSAAGCARMGILAEEARQSSAAMTGIVDRLCERGLVERQRDPADRRSVVVRLTEAGEQLLKRIREEGQERMRGLLLRLS
ncbi:MAG: MarR family winged helix-turn-helix transcriptional regulator, partial [Chloroflexia bacterium]